MNQALLLPVLLFFAFTAFGQSSPLPFARYSFNDGTLNDEIGQVNGSELGKVIPAADRFGNQNHAIAFTDSSAISFGDNFDVFSTPDAAFSFSLWLKNEDLNTTNLLFLSKYGNSNCGENQREFFIRLNDDKKIEFLFYSDIGSAVFNGFETTEEFFDTCWHHVVVNYNGNIDTNNGLDRVEIFVDGQKRTVQKSSNQSGNATDIQNSSSHLSLGTPVNSMGGICFFNTFLGRMDDVAFFDQTLSEAEVNRLYQAPSPTGSQNVFNALFNISELRICAGECIDITDQPVGRACEQASEWSFTGGTLLNGSPEAPLSICYSESGTFQITHILGNDYLKDTFVQNITVVSNEQDLLGQDTLLCAGGTIELRTPIQAEAYLWSDGSTGSSVTIDQPGLFWLEATINDCTIKDSINVNLLEAPSPALGPDRSICEGVNLTLNGTTPVADSYLWQNGDTTPELLVTQPGTYILEASNQCGSKKDTIVISEKGIRLNIDLGNDRLLCEQDSIRLDATTPGALTYRWNTRDTSPVIIITRPDIYQVTASNDCFEASDEVIITSSLCCKVFTPNIFSPNNDGINDIFKIQTNCSIVSFEMKIFNRWGGLVFESNDPNQGWNGRYRGELLPKSVYTWFIQYDDGSGEQIKSGTVALVR